MSILKIFPLNYLKKYHANGNQQKGINVPKTFIKSIDFETAFGWETPDAGHILGIVPNPAQRPAIYVNREID